jgi:predicted TIM-barrel fold metal-dependent hydrolase
MYLDRIDSRLREDASFNQVWEKNIWSTTSGPHTVRHFQQLRQVSPVERIMYSVDYPFIATTTGWAFVEKLAQSGVLSDAEMDAFAYKNAERLLKL